LPSRSHLKAVLSSRWINHMETKKKKRGVTTRKLTARRL
jgi:hypothetical protein